MTAWGEITGTLSNQNDLATALAGKAEISGVEFTGNVELSLESALVTANDARLTASSLFNNRGMQVGNGDTNSAGHLAVQRVFAGNVDGYNPQGADYIDGVRSTWRWENVNPNDRDKWQGIYTFDVLVPNASTIELTDLIGVNSQVTVFRADNTPFSFHQIYGGFFVGVNETAGNVSGALKGVEGRAILHRGTAAAVRGAMGAAVVRNTGGLATQAYGVYGILRIENAGGQATTGAGVFAVAQFNAGTVTDAAGVLIGNDPLFAGSGTNKIGLKIEAQTVGNPGGWTGTIANIHSAGNVPNIFDGVIRSTRAQGSPPLEVASNTLVTNLNANMIEGQNLAALDARYTQPRARQLAANRYYAPSGQSPSTGAAAVAANTLYAMPFNTALEMNAIAIEVTAAVAGSNARLGIYNCNAKGQPGQLIEEAGTVSTASTGIKEGALAAARPIRQPMWLVVLCSHAITLRTSAIVADQAAQIYGSTNLSTVPTTAAGATAAQAFGALPTNFPASTLLTTAYSVYARGT